MNKRLLFIVPIIVVILGAIAVFMLQKNNAPGKIAKVISGAREAYLAQAQEYETKNDLLNAKATYQKMISEFPSAAEIMNWQRKTEDLNIRLLFSPISTPKSTLYTIKPGDTLTKIAREFKTTIELIMKSNNLPSDKIIPGKKIKVSVAPFNIYVDKSQNILILKNDDEIIKTYTISTGTDNSTPVGTFKIVNKLVNPTWFKAGAVVPAGSAENVLGTRWLGFDLAGYGIHGTTEPKSLGKQATQGCVRMANAEVEELYAIVPVGTTVSIVD